jgi:hypothetical protein
MNRANIRRGISQARINYKNSNILVGEILFISIVAGAVNKSWWIFGAVLMSFFVALAIRPLAMVLIVALGLAWGGLGFGIGGLIGSAGASVVLGVIGLLASLGVHMSAVEWFKDNS